MVNGLVSRTCHGLNSIAINRKIKQDRCSAASFFCSQPSILPVNCLRRDYVQSLTAFRDGFNDLVFMCYHHLVRRFYGVVSV